MGDTTNAVQSAILRGIINPWVALAFCVGFGLGYLVKAIVG